MAERVALLVTGMHRSGTSALARTLSLLGGRLPDDLVPPNEGNPHGHWEPRTIVDLNDRMLADAGSDLYSTLDFDPAWFSTLRAKAFLHEAESVLDAAYAFDPFIILKDPRVALLLPIWDAALTQRGYAVTHLLPLRHPRSVAQSLRRRHLKTIAYDAWQRPRGELVWLRYTVAALQGSRGRRRSLIVYEAFLEDWRRELKRVGAELGIVWPRFGLADSDVDAFLQTDGGVETPSRGVIPSSEDLLGALDCSELAARLYETVTAEGDVAAATDRIADEYRDRTFRTRDLVKTLENLYPLVWTHYEDAKAQQRRNASAGESEGTLRRTVQTLWADLGKANGDKGVLRHDLFTAQERIQGLEREIRDANVAVEHRDAALDVTRSALEAARASLEEVDRAMRETGTHLDAVIADREAVRADGEETRLGLLESVEELTHEARILSREVDRLTGDNVVLHERFEAVVRSTSWTMTRPLRVIARIFRRAAGSVR